MQHSRTTTRNDPGTPSDEQLARRVQQGCMRSYEELDRRLRPRLVYLLCKRTGSREDAEDLTQQALMRAYQRIDQYQPGRSFRAWLYTIAVRLAIDAYRKRGIETTGAWVEHAIDPGPDPAETVGQQDTQRRLWALADRVLEPAQRTALWLHYGEQLNPKEIAKTLGLTAVHVRVLLYRARRKLLRHLEEPKPVKAVPKEHDAPTRLEPVRIPLNARQGARSRPKMTEGAAT